jgi:uncharacterized protein RhaS with RHS repeats
LTKDPIGYQGGENQYGYVGGDPLNWVDPAGKNPALVGIALVILEMLLNPTELDKPQSELADGARDAFNAASQTSLRRALSKGCIRWAKEKAKNRFKGGKQKDRDRTDGIVDPEFWRWWHQEKKYYGGNNAGSESDDVPSPTEAYNDWLEAGKPKVRK